MDKLTKFLLKLSTKEYQSILLLMEQIKRDYRKVPGVKALVGWKGFYRVRLGRYRVIFEVDKKGLIEIRRIIKRDESTYKGF